jgi:hypothetical protein
MKVIETAIIWKKIGANSNALDRETFTGVYLATIVLYFHNVFVFLNLT